MTSAVHAPLASSEASVLITSNARCTPLPMVGPVKAENHHALGQVWADNRDVSPCDLESAPGPASNNTGNRNENIYADSLTVAP